MNIKTALLVFALCNTLALGSTNKPMKNENKLPEKNFVFLISFDQEGKASLFLFNKRECTKKLMIPKSPHLKKITEEKINLVRKAIADIGTYPILNQFIIDSKDNVTLYPKAVLTLE